MGTYRKIFAFLQSTVMCKIKRGNHINNHIQARYVHKRNPPIKFLHTSTYLNKNVPFNLSDIGEGIREVVVKEWYVKIGDKVKQFNNICEVQSDKASVTITSRYDGIITKLYCKTEETVSVGQPLVDIDTEDDVEIEVVETASETAIKTPQEAPKIAEKEDIPPKTSPEEKRINFSSKSVICLPSVRRLAKQNKIDLSKVVGTGKNNQITKDDLQRYLDAKKEPTIATSKTSDSPSDVFIEKIVPVNTFQKAMVKSMTATLKIPLLTYSDEISVKKLTGLKNTLKTLPELSGIPISYMPFFIKAMSNALSQYPIINSHYDEEKEAVVYKRHHNIGVAMDTKMGLAIPAVKRVQELDVVEIAKELMRLIKCGKEGSFALKDLTDISILISNIGSIGGTYVKPLPISQTSSIIAFGAIQVLPRFDSNMNVFPDEIVALSASADHRIIDGATMARFVKIVKKQLENPHLLLLNL